MAKIIKKIVIVGGGTAGWVSAALLQKVLGPKVAAIELIESKDIATVGVGEATIPPIRHLNSVLELNEAEFMRATKATIKLAIKFENWSAKGAHYFHTFGAAGRGTAFCPFHHYWLRVLHKASNHQPIKNTSAKSVPLNQSLWDYDLNWQAATSNKFAKLIDQTNALELPYAYHFDAKLYAEFLRKKSELLGVKRTEGTIEHVTLNADSGNVENLILQNGKIINGDLFIDCSGFNGLLIQQKLNTGYLDWSQWLPCNKAVAVASQRMIETLPYTRAIAHSAGWQWRIPLQHRNGNGLVYSSNYYSDDEAIAKLLNNLDGEPLAEPRIITFTSGRSRLHWNRNVIAVGLASGFIEPLESTSIYLVQSAIVRLLKLFPHEGINPNLAAEYNTQTQAEYELIRDFIILHYHLNNRHDSQFWRDLSAMKLPEGLSHKIALFRANGTICRAQDDLFWQHSWLQVMLGQGVIPIDYHPLANAISDNQITAMLDNIKCLVQDTTSQMPKHDEFLKMFCS